MPPPPTTECHHHCPCLLSEHAHTSTLISFFVIIINIIIIIIIFDIRIKEQRERELPVGDEAREVRRPGPSSLPPRTNQTEQANTKKTSKREEGTPPQRGSEVE
eukprot:gene9492-6662_t